MSAIPPTSALEILGPNHGSSSSGRVASRSAVPEADSPDVSASRIVMWPSSRRNTEEALPQRVGHAGDHDLIVIRGVGVAEVHREVLGLGQHAEIGCSPRHWVTGVCFLDRIRLQARIRRHGEPERYSI